jgi:DNA-binding MarR family transcriptional regulator
MALLLCVYLGAGPHTVRGLAKDLKISKPAISRALDRLGELGYIRRERDDLDRRNVLVQRTPEGGVFLTNFSKMIMDAQTHSAAIPDHQALDFAFESLSAAAAAMGSPTEEKTAPSAWSNVAA